MADKKGKKQAPKFRRRRFYAPEIQKKYRRLYGVFVFFYAILFFGLTVAAPLLWAGVRMLGSAPPEYANREFIVLSENIWPAIPALICGAAFLSIFLTQRIGGPIYRLEQSAKELINGNLALRIHFRSYDKLDDLSSLLNKAITGLDDAIADVRKSGGELKGQLASALEALEQQPEADEQLVAKLKKAIDQEEKIEQSTKRFKLTDDE